MCDRMPAHAVVRSSFVEGGEGERAVRLQCSQMADLFQSNVNRVISQFVRDTDRWCAGIRSLVSLAEFQERLSNAERVHRFTGQYDLRSSTGVLLITIAGGVDERSMPDV